MLPCGAPWSQLVPVPGLEKDESSLGPFLKWVTERTTVRIPAVAGPAVLS